ncbi:class I SAM-dependent RNA methyltransferase [Roseivivax sediminis]|uniref:23S rRNA m(5)U-1939 methyltransferase n=1 Tax=Roseivivax sediminis TaxID=936889 RepID=A0A1I2A201_9RHOB|nr:class I SAM-dependent RNA methyltransferase [Roseivivax sediminis]SFE37839.1 23S rRNA m(5)U-1939 methyltransferase [Roseivivax sediminis]
MTTHFIERLGHRGDGIAPGPLYVPGTLPGEEVSGALEGDTIPAPKIVTPSADRVAPPCKHARACGGCQLQHASDGFVAAWKLDVVRAALAAHGLTAPMRPVATSPAQTRRRATLSARRTKTGALAGFHRKRSDEIVAIPECRVLHPDIAGALPLAEAVARLGASRKGEIAVQITRSADGLDVAVTGGKPADAALRSALADIARDHDLARLSWDADETLERRAPAVKLGTARVVPPPGAFLQATPEGEAALQDAVAEATDGARHIVDLFAGCGTFTLPLASRASVHAVEAGRDMLAALDRGWRHAHGLRQVTTEARDLFRNPLPAVDLARFDAAVIDPPRAGAEAQIAELAEAGPARIAHVSCNPVTFARDCATLARAGYGINWLQVVDQFRWSAHVEIVAQLSRT